MQKFRTSNLLLLAMFLILGAMCFQGCKKPDKCEGIQCQNGGTCVNGVCNCPAGFGGDNCEVFLCQDIICQNGGTCVNGTCNCPAGFGGDNCETFLNCDVLQPLCPPNSTCAVENGEAACYCNAGYEGNICETLTRSFYTNGNTLYTPLDVCTVGGPVIVGVHFTYSSVKFSNGATIDEFIMEDFGGFDSPPVNVKAKITGLNTFTVANQTQAGWGLTVKGQDNTNGTLNRATNKVILPYQITYVDGGVDKCIVEFTAQ